MKSKIFTLLIFLMFLSCKRKQNKNYYLYTYLGSYKIEKGDSYIHHYIVDSVGVAKFSKSRNPKEINKIFKSFAIQCFNEDSTKIKVNKKWIVISAQK